jgi:hypothetical protein
VCDVIAALHPIAVRHEQHREQHVFLFLRDERQLHLEELCGIEIVSAIMLVFQHKTDRIVAIYLPHSRTSFLAARYQKYTGRP